MGNADSKLGISWELTTSREVCKYMGHVMGFVAPAKVKYISLTLSRSQYYLIIHCAYLRFNCRRFDLSNPDQHSWDTFGKQR